MSEPTIRPVTPDDVPGIRRVARRGWSAAYADFLGGEAVETMLAEWYDPDDVTESVRRDDLGYFVATAETTAETAARTAEETVVGYAVGGPGDDDASEGVLGAIYVDPDRWGQGVGSRLLARVERFLARAGFDAMRFTVLAENDVGRSFYHAHGYECVETRETDLAGVTVEECVYRGSLDDDPG